MPAFISYIQTFMSCEGHLMGEFPVIFFRLKDMVCGRQCSSMSSSEPSEQEYAHTPKDMHLRSSVLFQRCVGSQNLLSGMEFLRNPHLAVTSCCSDELEGNNGGWLLPPELIIVGAEFEQPLMRFGWLATLSAAQVRVGWFSTEVADHNNDSYYREETYKFIHVADTKSSSEQRGFSSSTTR